ncbi:MAG: flagellar biosynthetic protein FliO [Lachnospiraceae bacterium]|nr:flagellar biosynthetic protein FliO [Lachnospiraceae bacterium]
MILLTMDTLGGIAQFITVLVLFVAVLWVTWAVTKWMGGYQKGKWAGGNIEMLESFRIASDKYVQIIRVADKYLAIAVSKDTVTVLSELEESKLVRRDDADSAKISFQKILEKVREKKKE